jgi:P4 family phage/plasmid primase-like protien
MSTHAGAARFLAELFGPRTTAPVYVTSLANDRGDAKTPPRWVVTRELEIVEKFAAKWDLPGRALYFCVSTIKPGGPVRFDRSRRTKDNLSELICLHVDIDLKSVDATPQEIERALSQLPLPPHRVNFTGHGFHCYWLFPAALAATPENIERVEAALQKLTGILAGDPTVAHAAALLRVPASHNTKSGEWIEVTTVAAREGSYALEQLEQWLATAGPVLRRLPIDKQGNGHDPDNPWVALAQAQGFKPLIDVERRLAEMQHHGPGESAIHPTQVSVTAALLSRGTPVEEVLATVLAATQAAAGAEGARWDWAREENGLRAMCASWLAKHPEIIAAKDAGADTDGNINEDAAHVDTNAADTTMENPGGGESTGNAGSGTAQAAPQVKARKSKPARPTIAMVIADGAIEALRQSGRDLLLTGGGLWIYREGMWTVETDADGQYLKVLLHQGAETLGHGADTRLIFMAEHRLRAHPALYREEVDWDASGKAALSNGVLGLRMRAFTPWAPEHFLRRKLGVAYDPAAAAPETEKWLRELVADRDSKTAEAVIGLLQEFLGASLCVPLLTREQRRALFLIGSSRTGKSELAVLISHLAGAPIASPAVKDISDRFGMEDFAGASAWIRDDAVNEGDKLDPERFKVIITGEPVNIRRKNKGSIRTSLTIPVVLTANSLPSSRDASDAVFNRSLVVELTRVFTPAEAMARKRELGLKDRTCIADYLFDREGPGILNWALAGLARLLERGGYDVPASVAAAIQGFKHQTNSVAEFADLCLERDLNTKVTRADLLVAFLGWWKDERGDDTKSVGGRWLFPKLRAACPWVVEVTIHGERFFGGLKVNDMGLKAWQRQTDEAVRCGRGARGSNTPAEVNQPWDGGAPPESSPPTSAPSPTSAPPSPPPAPASSPTPSPPSAPVPASSPIRTRARCFIHWADEPPASAGPVEAAVERLFAFACERHRIYLKRQAGEPKPWTNDPILQTYRFCNIYRELDAVTSWIREYWREPHADDPDLWFAMTIARLTNKVATFERLGYSVPWDRERFLEVMATTETTPYGAAYMIPAGAPSVPKPVHQADQIFDPLWAGRERLRPRTGDMLESFYARLLPQPGLGSFIRGQIIADAKYIEPLRSASDWYTFAVPGPGSKRGLNRVLGRSVSAPWQEADWRRELGKLQRLLEPRWPEAGMEPPHAQDLQNALCEWDKHERARLGEGKPKQRYDGGGHEE